MRLFITAAVAALVIGWAPAVSADPARDHLDPQYGRAFHAQRTSQQLNPSDGTDTTPVEDLDGVAATNAMKSFRHGYDRTIQGDAGVDINIGDYLVTDN